MKKQRNILWRSLLCLLLLACMLLLCACPANTPPDVTPPDEGENEGGEDDKTTTGGNTDTPPTPPDDDKPVIYGNGAPLADAGAKLSADSPVLTATAYDESGAEEIKANTFFRSAVKEKGKVFRVTDGKAVTVSGAAGQTYDGKGAVLIAPNGFLISAVQDVTLCDIVIIGSVTVEGAEKVTFKNVEIVSTATALSVASDCAEVRIESCRFVGHTAIATAASDTAVFDSYLSFTEAGFSDASACGTVLMNCVLEGNGTGIATVAEEPYIRYNTLTMGEGDIGISLGTDVLNALVAQNTVTGAQLGIRIEGVRNCSFVRNSLISVSAKDSRNLYIIDNAMGGRIEATNNNYFIADGNTYAADGKNHETVQAGNQNTNGDSLMDVDARLEVGADENLLPHVDKDQFVGMPRKEKVNDPARADNEQLTLSSYMEQMAKTEDFVIIQPGAYINEKEFFLNAHHTDTVIYGHGVYMERQEGLDRLGRFENSKNITVKGMTMGYKQQTCGQVYVLEKLNGNRVRVVTGAGMMNEFGNTNTKYYNTTGMGAQRMGTFYAYCDTSFTGITKDNSTAVPTMIMNLSTGVYQTTAVGDILTCRAASGGAAVSCYRDDNLKFLDVTIYGAAAGVCFYENEAVTGIQYYRVADTTQNGFLIEESLYNAYRALEEQYGVSLEVSVDDLGRYRGSLTHIGSVDATHVVACAEGSQATSCLFENMCDDATNQHSHHSRLAEIIDLGNGTAEIIYKYNLSEFSWGTGVRQPGSGAKPFKVGDRVYVYSAKGQLICDAEALTATVNRGSEPCSVPGTNPVNRFSITVPSDSVNFDALKGYDLSLDGPEPDQKVLVDNMSMAANYFKFDNSKFQNIRSRGLLIKASNGVIQNCTFRNIGMSCAAILYEIWWGESGVTEDLLVDRNLFDHTGYFANTDLYATVSITGLGSEVDEDFLLYKDIIISNNVMRNRTTNYAVYVNSAKNVKILNNTFEPFVGNNFTSHPEEPETDTNIKPAIHIFAAMDIEISGNTYSREDWIVEDHIHAEKNVHVYGTDVELNGVPLIPDDNK